VSLLDFFALPEAALLLLLVPALWLLLHRLDLGRTRRLSTAIGSGSDRLLSEFSNKERRSRRRLMGLGFIAAVLAVMQPLWGVDFRKYEQRGVDILICLDVSRSMLARDLPPNRLGAAHAQIRALSEVVSGDRLGLVAFAGEAKLQVPLTKDMPSLAEMAEATDDISVEIGGTDLGAALEVALAGLEGASGDHETILLISDGEDLEERGLRAAELCRQRNITVHCLGLGSALGSKITLEEGGRQSFLRTDAGEEVVSALDASGLKRIAESTGGLYLDASNRESALVDLYQQRILPMARKAFEAEERSERQNRFQWPLLLAFLFWMLEFRLTERRKGRK
jgi:Ca-activated chloride channel family protein